MLTIHLALYTSGRPQPDIITVSLNAVPSVHEMLSLGGELYRVEDVTHEIESMEIHVRAVR